MSDITHGTPDRLEAPGMSVPFGIRKLHLAGPKRAGRRPYLIVTFAQPAYPRWHRETQGYFPTGSYIHMICTGSQAWCSFHWACCCSV